MSSWNLAADVILTYVCDNNDAPAAAPFKNAASLSSGVAATGASGCLLLIITDERLLSPLKQTMLASKVTTRSSLASG